MLSDFKKFVKNNESDIFLTISIVLISLIIFGSIILINSKENESIMIQNPSASVIENIMINSDESIEQGSFVGSINSIKYHWSKVLTKKEWIKWVNGMKNESD